MGFDKLFDQLPPSVRHAFMLVVIGFGLASFYFAFDARVSAAQTDAKEAKQRIEKTDDRLDKLMDSISDLAAIAKIHENEIQAAKEAADKADKRLDRIEDKLDRTLAPGKKPSDFGR